MSDDGASLSVVSVLDEKRRGYTVTVTFGQDVVVPLGTPAAAIAYANAVTTEAVRARHDAALLHLLATRMGMDSNQAGHFVQDLRDQRPAPDRSATRPLVWDGGVSMFTGQPFIRLSALGGSGRRAHLTQRSVQLSPGQAEQHALHVIEQVHAAALDQQLLRYLTTPVDDADERMLPLAAATNVIRLLGECYHPDAD